MEKYKNPALSPEERAKDLLKRMTTREKVAQMTLHRREDFRFDPEEFDKRNPDGIGSTYHTEDLDPKDINRMQKHVMENTRLGIPMYVMGESLHGFMCDGATAFPMPIGLGATFDDDLIHDAAKAMGKEVRAYGVHETYAPNLDLAKEPRWGRTAENYGEDPYLTGRMGYAYVTGIQSEGVAASPKHYLAHGTPESGLNAAPVHMGEREIRETCLRPFKAAFTDAKAMSVMPAYSELDGVPLHGSRYWLTDVLRGELGFEGWVVSDWGAIHRMMTDHFVTPDKLTVGLRALRAGVDMEAPNTHGYGENLVEAADKDPKIMEMVNLATYRLLLGKFKLGLFENPYADPNAKRKLRTKKARELSERCALESAVLLKNNGVLPLDEKAGETIALIGPGGKITQLGGYTSEEASNYNTTLYGELQKRIGKKLLYAQGSSVAFTNEKALKEAYETALKADKVVLVLSAGSGYYARRQWADNNIFADGGKSTVNCGEGFDVDSLAFPDAQLKLLKRVAKAKKPLIVLSMTGRPQLMKPVEDLADAVMQVWYPGQEGGTAMAKLLFGDVNPSGKLPITFPLTDGQLPVYYNHKVSRERIAVTKMGTPEHPGRSYVFGSPLPLHPFGFGLSYTTFAYSNLKVKDLGGTDFEAAVTVMNTGDREGTEVVQLYLRDDYCRITPFIKQLRGFKRVSLKPGQKKRVKFAIGFEDLCFINEEMKQEVEPGTFTAEIGDLKASFEVVE